MDDLLEKAIAIALKAHKGQKDKAGEPYILHPLRVMMSLQTTEEKIIGVLHDVVEDSSTTTKDLVKKGFSKKIVLAVDALTKKEGVEYDKYIAGIKKNDLARRVKLMDLKDNMDLKRRPKITQKFRKKLAKYKKAWKVLKG